jgi:uncharacterized RDD family membrane protein YckC
MKCPKCEYLGFETGDRCRNCGYDFSLLAEPAHPRARAPELDLNLEPSALMGDGWRDELDLLLGTSAAATPPIDLPLKQARESRPVQSLPPAAEPALPLFRSGPPADDDAPLLTHPSPPRAPLSVRRTTETRRVRPPARSPRDTAEEPALQFGDLSEAQADQPVAADASVTRRLRAMVTAPGPATSGVPRRVVAALIDHALLLAIDAAVIYFTLRMASLSTSEWTLLPPVPMLAFLALVKLSYFCAFTAVGGQTIGKMAMGIRVVADDDDWVDASRAVRRTIVGALSTLTVGLVFLPALVSSDRRALHDRVARTRVVMLRSA